MCRAVGLLRNCALESLLAGGDKAVWIGFGAVRRAVAVALTEGMGALIDSQDEENPGPPRNQAAKASSE
ncbi:hypothetical protein BVK86_03050 [Pseudomonas reinekei]|uniref:Uncharacterized protein n=1 Tax=Pseudomonas reinekei TaxID=395598 RepID=A0A1Q9X2N2_PSERE|nr:hypothetical protein BVK86_03050 [Pseudomonas reinekei]